VDGAPTQNGQQEQGFDLGPLVGRKRGFKTKERIPFSGGMGGIVMSRDDEMSPCHTLPASPSSPLLHGRSVKGKERAIDGDGDSEMVDGRDKPAGRVFEIKSMSFFLLLLFFAQTFLLDSQVVKQIPHESLRTSLQSPNQLKPHSTFNLRPPDPGGPYQHVTYDQPQPENEDSMPPKMRKRWMHRELAALRELNGNTSPSSSRDSNHNHVGRLSQSPGGSSSSCVSQGSPSNQSTKGPDLGITCNNEYRHGRFSFRVFSLNSI